MKYVQLRAFHNVALHGGFSRAAQAMDLTQPAVSDQVLALEQAYDVLLFDRSKKQIRLTARGKQLLSIVRPMFEVESQAQEYLSAARAITSGTLRLIADSAFHLTDVLSRFRARYPGVHIRLRSGNSAEVEAELAAWRADIGVLGSAIDVARFHSVSLGATPIVAFAARGFARFTGPSADLSELVKYPLVLRETGSKTRAALEQTARRLGIRLSPAIEADGREAVREIVAARGGIGFVSDAEFGQDRRLVKIPVSGVPMMMQETLICVAQRKEVRMIRAFMSLAAPS